MFAGLFPALRQEKGAGQQAVWQILDLRPGTEPLHALIETFDPPDEGLSRTQKLAAINAGVELLRQRKVTLAQLVRDRLKDDPGTTRLLLYVDQWEELYTQAQPRDPKTAEDQARAADARLFVDLALDAAANSPCTLVLGVRSDFYPDLQTHDRLRTAVQDCQVSLGPMTKSELTAAIEGPAKVVGGSVEPELTRKLLRDIGLDPADPGADHYDIGKLPLLEYALEQAWAKAKDGRLGLAHYAGLEQALEERANAIYDRLPPDQQAAAKRLFVSLVTPGEGREDTRARVTLSTDATVEQAASAFTASDARLIVTGDDAAGARSAEVSHEALIRHWERLRGWIDENRANLRTRSALVADRDDWLKDNRDPTLLIPPGLRLAAARALRNEPGDVKTDDLLDYIQASEDAELAAREAAEAARAAQHQRELDGAREIAEQQRQRAEAERQIADEQRQRANAEARAAVEQRQRAEAERHAADEQRQRADAERARARTLRWTVALVAGAALIAIGFALYAWYAKGQIQQEADKTTAALIWARLDYQRPDDPKGSATVDALWDLVGATTAVRDAFLQQLAEGRYQVEILASGSASIGRAFGLEPPADVVQRLLGPVLDAIPKTIDPDQLQALDQAVQSLAPKLSPEQAQAALGPVLDAIPNTTSPSALQALAQAVQSLAPKLSPEQAQAALGPVLDAIPKTTDPDQIQALAQAVQSLTPTPEQAQAALGPVLDAIPKTTDPYQLQDLAQAVQSLAPKLSPEQAQASAEPLRTVLTTTDDPAIAAAFARAIAVALPLDPIKPQPYAAAIVELLKWPTTAEPGATEALLEVLHDRLPAAPGKEAGLAATVRWVATTFPEIDLDSPPTPPASGSTGAAW